MFHFILTENIPLDAEWMWLSLEAVTPENDLRKKWNLRLFYIHCTLLLLPCLLLHLLGRYPLLSGEAIVSSITAPPLCHPTLAGGRWLLILILLPLKISCCKTDWFLSTLLPCTSWRRIKCNSLASSLRG